MIVQSQLDGQLYEVPDHYGALSGYEEYIDPGLGLPFLAALIPKIASVASGILPMDKLITNVCPLDELEWGLRQLEKGGEVMKVLIECS